MYLKCLLICQLLAVLLVRDSLALPCLPCFLVRCPWPSDCPGGTVVDKCGCCPTCAKVEGEECGGLKNKLGVCDKGLECVKSKQFNSIGVCIGILNYKPTQEMYPEEIGGR